MISNDLRGPIKPSGTSHSSYKLVKEEKKRKRKREREREREREWIKMWQKHVTRTTFTTVVAQQVGICHVLYQFDSTRLNLPDWRLWLSKSNYPPYDPLFSLRSSCRSHLTIWKVFRWRRWWLRLLQVATRLQTESIPNYQEWSVQFRFRTDVMQAALYRSIVRSIDWSWIYIQ